MAGTQLHVPQKLRRGKFRFKEEKSVRSGAHLLALMCRALELEHLGDTRLLDMGCGCKFTQSILGHDLPIRHYTGVDVYAEMIGFLQSTVTDERFEYHCADLHNEMYNPTGEKLSPASRLPLEEGSFDLICAFSVFTHLEPGDYAEMLRLLRRYVKPGGRLFYTLFVNERTPGGYGWVDMFTAGMEKVGLNKLAERRSEFEGAQHTGVPDFVDAVAGKPLRVAMYSREHALRLVEGTGWRVRSLNDPEKHIQHYMICEPV